MLLEVGFYLHIFPTVNSYNWNLGLLLSRKAEMLNAEVNKIWNVNMINTFKLDI